MENYIIIAIIALVVGASLYYLIRAKRRGDRCIGCPYAKSCGGKCGRTIPREKAVQEKDTQN